MMLIFVPILHYEYICNIKKILSTTLYTQLLSNLHWGQLLKLKWYFEDKLKLSLHMAPFTSNEVIKDEFDMIDVQTIFSLYFQEGQQNQTTNQEPLVELYQLRGDELHALRKIIRDRNLQLPTLKELRKIRSFQDRESVEV